MADQLPLNIKGEQERSSTRKVILDHLKTEFTHVDGERMEQLLPAVMKQLRCLADAMQLELSMEQEVGLMVHIACCFERLVAGTCSPSNRWADEILQEDGYDNVATKRVTRTGEPRIRSFLSESFYKFVNAISKTEIVDGARDYRLMKRKMVQAVLEMSEYNRFSKGIFGWVGFRTKWLQYVEGITGFSVAPLSLASVVGVLFCVLSFIMIAVIVVRTLVWGDPVSGWPSLACIIFMVSGVQLLCTGIVGEYLSKTYLETKKRPIFILKDST